MDTVEKPSQIVREEFAATESRALVETASSAVAAQARASVEARYVVALQRPRNWDRVRVTLLKECDRSSFAEVAIYRKPIGEGVEGPSIRFAEAAMRAMGNILPEVSTIYDDTSKRIVRVSVTDLECNLTYSKDVVIQKTVERRNLGKEQTPIASRFNSKGQRVYIVEATDDDILNKENALISKAIRTNGLRLLPGDLLDECMRTIRETRKAGIEADPDAARKKIVDAFFAIGVQPEQIRQYLGHDLSMSSPAELDQLRSVYSAIRDGEATWLEVMDSVSTAEGGTDEQTAKRTEERAALREKIAAARNKNGNGKPATEPVKAAAPEVPTELAKPIKLKAGTFPDATDAEWQILANLRERFGENLMTLRSDGKKIAEALVLIGQFRTRKDG